MNLHDLTTEIRQSFLKVYNSLGQGFSPEIYQRALMVELDNLNLTYRHSHDVNVYYEGISLGKCRVDFLVENELIVMIGTENLISERAREQLKNMCSATYGEEGILLNFGSRPGFFQSLKGDEVPMPLPPIEEGRELSGGLLL